MTQGQSDYTSTKLGLLAACLKPTFAVLAKHPHRPAWYIDCHAGSGANSGAALLAPIVGSPVVALRASRSVRAYHTQHLLIESNQRAARHLADTIAREGETGRALIFRGNNADGIRFAQRMLPPSAAGAIFVDPNGYYRRNADGSGVPTEELEAFAASHKGFDIILNLNIRTFRLGQGHVAKATSEARHFAGDRKPSEVLAALSRVHWWIGHFRTRANGGHLFLFAVGRNWGPQHTPRVLYRIDTPQGAALLRHLDGAPCEVPPPHVWQPDQPDLFAVRTDHAA